MQRQNVIVLEKCPSTIEVFGSLKRACEAHDEFQYHSIKMLKFPFTHKGYIFHKVKFNSP